MKCLGLELEDDEGVKWVTDVDNLLLCARDHIGKTLNPSEPETAPAVVTGPSDVILLANLPQGPKPAPS